jgi:hypothetical protein
MVSGSEKSCEKSDETPVTSLTADFVLMMVRQDNLKDEGFSNWEV